MSLSFASHVDLLEAQLRLWNSSAGGLAVTAASPGSWSSPNSSCATPALVVLRGRGSPAQKHWRLEGTVERLAEFALPGGGNKDGAGSCDPEVKRLRADLDALHGRVDVQGKDISEIKSTSAANQAVCMETNHMMTKLLVKFEQLQDKDGEYV